jgi:hypothetical protein
VVTLGDRIDRFAPRPELEDPLAGLRTEATVGSLENLNAGVFLIVVLDGVADRLDTAVETLRDPAMNVGRAGARGGQPACPSDDLPVLLGESWLKRLPRSMRSGLSETNRSTSLARNPTRFRPPTS